MSAGERVGRIITGVLMIVGAFLIIYLGDNGYLVIAAILGLSLIVSGIGMLINYFKLSRFMVGGRRYLYMGLFILDLGLFASSLNNVPKIYIVLYLVIIRVITGAVNIIRAFEEKKYGSGAWKLTLAIGIANALAGLACLFFIRQMWLVIIIYSGGLIYTAVLRIISAFRPTAIVFIQ